MAEHLAGRRLAAMSIEGRPIYSMLLPIAVGGAECAGTGS
jgi:hypothetical protein